MRNEIHAAVEADLQASTEEATRLNMEVERLTAAATEYITAAEQAAADTLQREIADLRESSAAAQQAAQAEITALGTDADHASAQLHAAGEELAGLREQLARTAATVEELGGELCEKELMLMEMETAPKRTDSNPAVAIAEAVAVEQARLRAEFDGYRQASELKVGADLLKAGELCVT